MYSWNSLYQFETFSVSWIPHDFQVFALCLMMEFILHYPTKFTIPQKRFKSFIFTKTSCVRKKFNVHTNFQIYSRPNSKFFWMIRLNSNDLFNINIDSFMRLYVLLIISFIDWFCEMSFDQCASVYKQ